MGRKLLIVASKRYGDYVKEIAESMGCFEKISFVDNDREGAIGKLEDVESFYPEYNCAIAACDDGTERLEWNKKLEALYNIPVLFHMDSTISPSANLMPGCIVEPRAVVGCGSTIGQATVMEDCLIMCESSVTSSQISARFRSLISSLQPSEAEKSQRPLSYNHSLS